MKELIEVNIDEDWVWLCYSNGDKKICYKSPV